jgi:hypothetical protein
MIDILTKKPEDREYTFNTFKFFVWGDLYDFKSEACPMFRNSNTHDVLLTVLQQNCKDQYVKELKENHKRLAEKDYIPQELKTLQALHAWQLGGSGLSVYSKDSYPEELRERLNIPKEDWGKHLDKYRQIFVHWDKAKCVNALNQGYRVWFQDEPLFNSGDTPIWIDISFLGGTSYDGTPCIWLEKPIEQLNRLTFEYGEKGGYWEAYSLADILGLPREQLIEVLEIEQNNPPQHGGWKGNSYYWVK